MALPARVEALMARSFSLVFLMAFLVGAVATATAVLATGNPPDSPGLTVVALRVVDASAGTPVPGAMVWAGDQAYPVDEHGTAQIEIIPGTPLRVEAPGYAPRLLT